MAESTAVEHDARAAEASAEGENENEEQDEVVQLSIAGDGDLSLSIGGSKPNEATLNFNAGEIKLSGGQFKAGQRVAVLIVGVIDEIGVKHKKDPKTKQLTNITRKHHLLPDEVRRVALEAIEPPR